MATENLLFSAALLFFLTNSPPKSMKNFTWFIFLLLLGLPSLVQAQTTTVTGKVTDAKGGALPGVTVLVRGTQRGISTNAEGTYSIAAPDSAALVFSSVGFDAQTVPVRSQAVINVTMNESTQALNEVVVTALGVAKERKALGYSVTEIAGPSLTQARETNVANSLVGKVAGLNVNSTAGGPGSSSNVIIRGASSISQTNQPLYVINGIPVESQPSGGAGATIGNSGGQYDNAPDFGDPISNLNPDDIESISVLKGAAASALYGYRGKAGVILITTKSAKGNDGIELNSNYVAQRAFNLTDWQYEYGQGSTGIKPATAAAAAQSGNSSWGRGSTARRWCNSMAPRGPTPPRRITSATFTARAGPSPIPFRSTKALRAARCASRPATWPTRRWCPTRASTARRLT